MSRVHGLTLAGLLLPVLVSSAAAQPPERAQFQDEAIDKQTTPEEVGTAHADLVLADAARLDFRFEPRADVTLVTPGASPMRERARTRQFRVDLAAWQDAESPATAPAGAKEADDLGAEAGPPVDGAAASNPLAAVNNTDLKWTYFNLKNGSRRNDYWVRGGWSFASWGKLNYEVTYQESNITGSSETDWESVSLKPIFFFKQGEVGSWKYKLATGFEWIIDFDNRDKGIGSGSDIFSPLFGIALSPQRGTTIVPLVQHFVSYDGPNVNTTGGRLIFIQRLPEDWWTKLDFIVPYDWSTSRIPATVEVELGKMLTPNFGVYVSGLSGLGGDRSLDWGASLNVRFAY